MARVFMNSIKLLFKNISLCYSENFLIISNIYPLNISFWLIKNWKNSSKLSLQASSISGWNIFYKVLEYRLKLTLSTTSYMESNKNIFFKISLANIHKSESHKESKIKTLIFSYISTQVYASLSSKGLYKQPIKISRCTL